MLHIKPPPTVIHFTQLLTALVKMKHYSLVLSLFRDMRNLSIPVNIVTFSTAINCCCHMNRLDYAFSLLGMIIKCGFTPNDFTYTIIIRGLISRDEAVEAESLFKKLVRFKDIQHNVVTYNTIIDGLCKKGHTYMAITLFKYMQRKGCKPNIVTYSILIDSLCKDSLVDNALGLFAKMSEKG